MFDVSLVVLYADAVAVLNTRRLAISEDPSHTVRMYLFDRISPSSIFRLLELGKSCQARYMIRRDCLTVGARAGIYWDR